MYSTVIDDRLPLQAGTASGPLPSGAGSHPANFQARPDAPRLRNLDLLRPNFWVRAAFYCTLLAIPFLRLYVLGTGERVGVQRVVQGIDGRSTIFGQNANEIGEIYGVALVALVALGLFRDTKQKFRFIVFPLAALVAIGLAKTGSRTGTLFALLGILILLPQTRAFVPTVKRYVVILLLAAV